MKKQFWNWICEKRTGGGMSWNLWTVMKRHFGAQIDVFGHIVQILADNDTGIVNQIDVSQRTGNGKAVSFEIGGRLHNLTFRIVNLNDNEREKNINQVKD